MSLLECLKEPPEPKSRMAAILLAVTPEEREALQEALRSPEWPHEALASVLTDSGHKISEASVRRHRKGLGL